MKLRFFLCCPSMFNKEINPLEEICAQHLQILRGRVLMSIMGRNGDQDLPNLNGDLPSCNFCIAKMPFE